MVRARVTQIPGLDCKYMENNQLCFIQIEQLVYAQHLHGNKLMGQKSLWLICRNMIKI